MLDEPPCIVTEFVEGEGMEAEELREPATLVEVARGAARDPRRRRAPADDFDSFRIVETYAATRGERGATVPDAYERARTSTRRAIEAALSGPEHEPGPLPQRPARRQLHPRRRAASGSSTGSTPGMGDRYFDLGNFAVNNELDEAAARRRCSSAYFGEPPGARRLADAAG